MKKVVIIGGGVVGLCSAYYLRRAGWDVTVVDKGNMTDSCSYGNAGMIVPSHFVPLAGPGIVRQGVRWLLNPKGPLQVRPEPNMDWLRWTYLFIRNASRKHVERSAMSLKDISLLSKSLYEQLDRDLDVRLRQRGVLMLSATEKSYAEEQLQAQRAIAMGLDVACLSKEDAIQLQDGLAMSVVGGVHYRSDAHLDPSVLMHRLIERLTADGVHIIPNNGVDHVHRENNRMTGLTLDDGQEIVADAFVLTAGVWSAHLASKFSFRLPMMPGKGYSFMTGASGMRVRVPMLLCEARVAITPLGESIRFGGTMELGRMNTHPNMRRVQGIVEAVNRYFPESELQIPAQSTVWQGFRPCSADGLPYIGFSKKVANLLIATGHGMMGLSLGPATGSVISELLSEVQTSVDIKLFSPDRFD